MNNLTYQGWQEKSNNNQSINNGNIPQWNQVLEVINALPKGVIKFDSPYIKITSPKTSEDKLVSALRILMPWRKGPFMFNDVILDSEWQGDMKWQRLINHIQPLEGKRVLDVGAGNGYFSLRMAMNGAEFVLGIEPFLLFNYQFRALKSLIKLPLNISLLSLRLEEMTKAPLFDSVFSMGVLYHQRDHMSHLNDLRQMMKPKAELVLETLIVEGEKGYKLTPEKRYARMRNVYCLPSIETLKSWLIEANFHNIRVVNVCKTTIQEQRRSTWIGENTASLEDFLDPHDSSLTMEGYPAPTRAIVICQN
ncbi:MAG: tRNA 5-methoxyuridine(34)/uridine 5-oxyacetic acid(34) synthase CmoB [Gammaproteobacteria bacterium]|nr:tRNA 5-methoxyuridine(34)/uridine 5-oxyacetic acid(34) synthase CmoB [Gammaproteobacteria bacterium]